MSMFFTRVLLLAWGLVVMTSVADAADLIGQNGSIYFAIAGGFDNLFDTNFDAGVVAGTINFNPGWIGALAIGTHVSQSLRAEIEVSSQSVSLDDEEINGLGRIDLSGDVQVIAVMAKIDYDFDLGSIRHFVGAGIGVANFAVDLGAPIQFEESDSVLAGMGEAGIGVPLTPDIEAFGKAQVMVLDDVSIDSPGGSATLDHPTMASIPVGLRVGF
jgi:opacity protein-like surface antigen